MCGILAYYSNDKLKKLHHRGQDTIGVSFIYNGKFKQILKIKM